MSLEDYFAFVQSKAHSMGNHGFKPVYQNEHCFEFQNALIEWALEKGRSAIFADCGLGKTLMQLVWAENVHRKTNKPVLVLAPLSVASQTVDEAAKFGIEAIRSRQGEIKSGIVTANYERLHYFSPDDFGGVVCDESSILKNDKGATRAHLTRFLSKVPYRAMFTATPSPNDYTELGTTSEALGALPYMEMLEAFFISNDNSLHPDHIGDQWRFKPHAEADFWRWVTSWSRMIRKPSDIGFSDKGYDLPELHEIKHTVKSPPKDGDLFVIPAKNMVEVREERHATRELRCQAAAEVITQHEAGVMWCQFNAEADLLVKMVDGAVNLSGADSDEEKEDKFDAFRSGEIKYLVTKPSIAAMGVNWQHVNAFTYFDDYSYEQYYQAVRRMWRFGQKRPVYGYQIGTEGLANVRRNRDKKSVKAEDMFQNMMSHMLAAQSRMSSEYARMKPNLPTWL